MKIFTNCTPQGIVAAIGFTRLIYEFRNDKGDISFEDVVVSSALTQELVRRIFQAFSERQISMKSFIKVKI